MSKPARYQAIIVIAPDVQIRPGSYAKLGEAKGATLQAQMNDDGSVVTPSIGYVFDTEEQRIIWGHIEGHITPIK